MTQIDVYNEIKNYIIKYRDDIAVNPGTITSTNLITPQSYVVYKNRVMLAYAEALQTLFNIELLLSDDAALEEIADVENKSVDDVKLDISNFIDKIASNFGKTRYAATYATATVYFGRNEVPDTDKTIPQSQIVKTLDGIEFSVDSTVVMSAALGSSYYDPDYRRYLIAVPVTCTSAGISGNVVSNSISKIVGSISGINYVTNKDNITNGQDEETDEQFIARLKTTLSGNTFGSKDGYKNLIMSNFRDVKDVLVVTPGNPLMLRDNGLGGMIDIYVLTEIASTAVTETFNSFNYFYDVASKKGVILTNNPVDENVAITAPTSGILVKDTSELSNSYAENSVVYFTTIPSTPFNITYNYHPIISSTALDINGNPEGIQTFLNQDKYAILGNIMTTGTLNSIETPVLVKLATKVLINITANIVVLTGYDATQVITACETAVNNYIGGLLLGDSLAQSDIIGVLENVAGVDSVDTPMSIFNTTTGSDAQVNEIVIDDNEYIRLNAGGLIITA